MPLPYRRRHGVPGAASEIRERKLPGDGAGGQPHDAVGVRGGAHAAGGEHDGDAGLSAESHERADQEIGALGIEARPRLVGEDEPGPPCQRPGNGGAHLFAPGEAPQRGAGSSLKAKRAKRVKCDATVAVGDGDAAGDGERDAVEKVGARSMLTGVGYCAYLGSTEMPDDAWGGPVQPVTQDRHAPGSGPETTRDYGEQRRLARAAWPRQSQDLPAGDSQGNAVEGSKGGGPMPVAFGDCRELDDRRVVFGSRSSSAGRETEGKSQHANAARSRRVPTQSDREY
jgi:hypothetical protein